MDKTEIFVITHKKCDLKLINSYSWLFVGMNSPQKDLLTDSTGDNISNKNPYYCELTGLYWIYKNIRRDVVGLVHYRRFFVSKFSIFGFKILSVKKINKILRKYQIILPYKAILKDNKKVHTVYEQFCLCHHKSDLDATREVIAEIYPDYLESFDQVMNKSEMFMFNMFISKKEILDKYCKRLFDILFELEKRIDIGNYDNYQKRVFGFISERLLNVWVFKNSLSVCYSPVYNIEKNAFKQKIRYLLKRANV